MTKKIQNMQPHERPREKLLEKGARALSDAELLAVLLGKGSARQDVLSLAAKVVPEIDQKGFRLSVDDLSRFDGIGPAKAALILASLEFARRRIKPDGFKISQPSDLLPLVRHYADRRQEHFLCASVNGANEIIQIRVVSIGLIDKSPAHPREVFADPITDRASAVILAHNHPAGTLTPSDADLQITRRLKDAGDLMGITVLDHIIFNHKGYYSFLEHGDL